MVSMRLDEHMRPLKLLFQLHPEYASQPFPLFFSPILLTLSSPFVSLYILHPHWFNQWRECAVCFFFFFLYYFFPFFFIIFFFFCHMHKFKYQIHVHVCWKTGINFGVGERVNYVSCEMSNCSPYRKIYNSARCGKHYVLPSLHSYSLSPFCTHVYVQSFQFLLVVFFFLTFFLHFLLCTFILVYSSWKIFSIHWKVFPEWDDGDNCSINFSSDEMLSLFCNFF